MTRSWEAGTQYNLGDVVEYNGQLSIVFTPPCSLRLGHKYQIIQPHHSQSDWAPDRTPALWGRKSDDHHDGHHGHHQPEHHNQGDHHHQQQGQRHEQQQQSFEKPQSMFSCMRSLPSDLISTDRYSPPPVENKTEISHEERKKPWYDLSDDRKQQLEIGGGLLAGAAVIGAGYFAYKEHEKNDEEVRHIASVDHALIISPRKRLRLGLCRTGSMTPRLVPPSSARMDRVVLQLGS